MLALDIGPERRDGRADRVAATAYSKGKGGSMHMFFDREEILWRPRHCRRRKWPIGAGPRFATNISTKSRQPRLFR